MDDAAKHSAGVARRLGHLAGLAAETDAAERRILESAEQLLEKASAELDQLRPRVHTDPAAGDRYLALTAEWGRLHQVASKARQALGMDPA